MTIEFKTTIPLLRIFDVAKAKEFYVGFLGFKIDWEHRFDENAPLYMQIARDGLTMHLTEHYGDCSPGAKVFVWMTGIEEFHQQLTATKYNYMRPGLQQTFYNSKCVEVVDPFHNRISFNEPLPNE